MWATFVFYFQSEDLYDTLLCLGVRASGCRHPGAEGQDALGGERDRRLPVSRRHRVLHHTVLPGPGEAEPVAGHAETRHPRGAGARAGQHPGEGPRGRHARLSHGSRRQCSAEPVKVNHNRPWPLL